LIIFSFAFLDKNNFSKLMIDYVCKTYFLNKIDYLITKLNILNFFDKILFTPSHNQLKNNKINHSYENYNNQKEISLSITEIKNMIPFIIKNIVR
jgi:hypothetical protein